MKSWNLKAFLQHTSEEATEADAFPLEMCENSSTRNDDLDLNSCALLLNEDLRVP